mmetsp:Transcript_5482/g.12092  ORF Transcript_5482/g.12092 Transcript_5482/m.12092 type:complete len:222 (+) Transcript_5482:363-1028(+)
MSGRIRGLEPVSLFSSLNTKQLSSATTCATVRSLKAPSKTRLVSTSSSPVLSSQEKRPLSASTSSVVVNSSRLSTLFIFLSCSFITTLCDSLALDRQAAASASSLLLVSKVSSTASLSAEEWNLLASILPLSSLHMDRKGLASSSGTPRSFVMSSSGIPSPAGGRNRLCTSATDFCTLALAFGNVKLCGKASLTALMPAMHSALTCTTTTSVPKPRASLPS